MNIIVDGYNMIFRLGWQNLSGTSLALERSRDRLIRELAQRFPPAARSAVAVVFDAKQTPIKETVSDTSVQGFRIIFAQAHDEADSLIEELIRKHATPKKLTVVSSDNRLIEAATRRKATAFTCEQWLDYLASNATRQATPISPLSPYVSSKDAAVRSLEATDWLAEFGFDDELAELDVDSIEALGIEVDDFGGQQKSPSRKPINPKSSSTDFPVVVDHNASNHQPQPATSDADSEIEEVESELSGYDPFPPGYFDDLDLS